MKKYENPEIMISGFAFENDVLTVSFTDFNKAETGSDKDNTIGPGEIKQQLP